MSNRLAALRRHCVRPRFVSEVHSHSNRVHVLSLLPSVRNFETPDKRFLLGLRLKAIKHFARRVPGVG